MNRRIQVILAMLLTAAVGAVFYFSFFRGGAPRNDTNNNQPDSQADQNQVLHPLTGLPYDGKDFFVASVMLDNMDEVRVRPGLEYAGVVYEAPVEGGITRLMAVFDTSQEVKQFGPVRSLRPYFVDWASEYGGVIMHVGGSPDGLRLAKTSEAVQDVDQIGAQEIYFTRDETLEAPHNVFSSFSAWRKLGERLKIPLQQVTPWQYASSSQPTASTQQITITYSPSNHVGWVYTAERQGYIRFKNSERELFGDGNQISTANVIVIEVPIEVVDSIGRLRVTTLGKGQAKIYTQGQEIAAQWMKETASSRMRFVDEAYRDVTLAPGVTWIQVVPAMGSVSLYQTTDRS